ncbi:MAG: ABC transporter ATP-binding protein [Clostridia bacterium]|nr:ABC transporter ATP-binding protein [Clostridia bacterium]
MSELKIRSLFVKIGGRHVVNGADFLADGNVTVLLGRNGCGKSTLLKAILGLIPSKGDIFLNGQDIRRLKARERAKRFSYLPQRQSAPSGVAVIDYVSMGSGGVFLPPDKEAVSRAEKELNKLELSQLSDRRISTLSGGELRLAGLARARVQCADFMILDEPLAGLDFARQHEFMQLLKSEKSSVLMSMHDPMLAWQYADSILLMDDGKIFSCDRNDEKSYEVLLNKIYGHNLRFTQVDDMKIPIWHTDSEVL